MRSLFLCIVTFFSSISYGQGNLQFNQAFFIGGTPISVPTGKVWKIESALLSIKDGIRVVPQFSIGADTVILGYDSYTVSQLENIVSVTLEWKGSNYGVLNNVCSWVCSGHANGASDVVLSMNGIGTGASIYNQSMTFSNVPNTENTAFVPLGTLSTTSANNSISSFNLTFRPIPTLHCTSSSCYSYGFSYSFRVVFLLANGNAYTYTFNESGDGSGTSPLRTINGPTIATETRTRPQTTTSFPIWVPAGNSVKTISNISKLSVLEFNITP